jgi:hypothetical protein
MPKGLYSATSELLTMYMPVEQIAPHVRKAACYRERRKMLWVKKHRHDGRGQALLIILAACLAFWAAVGFLATTV